MRYIEFLNKAIEITRDLYADTFKNNQVDFKINKFDDVDLIKYEVEKFKKSNKLRWMEIGENYYKNENDIKDKKAYRYTTNEENEDSIKIIDKDADIKRIAHAFMKLIVDTKLGYVLSKPPSIKSEDKNYSALLNKVFSYKNHKAFKDVGKEAINKGIGWIHPTIVKNELIFKKIDAKEIIPLWTDGEHTELNGIIRFYETIEITKNTHGDFEEITKTKYELWDKEKVYYFVDDDNGDIVIDSEKYLQNNGLEYFHISKNEIDSSGNLSVLGKGWGEVPFIPFKKDDEECPEIRFTKDLIDDYDEKVSDNSTHVQELPDSLFAVTGVSGTNPAKFKENIKKFGIMFLDDADSKVETISRNLIVEAFKTHLDTIERNIYLFSRSVDKNNDRYGNNPSGVSLKFLYQDMDDDCNNLELEFKNSFYNLKYFIDTWLKQTGQGDFFDSEAEIIFNKSLLVNEGEIITNLKNSVGMISDETLMINHPYVDDVAVEKKRMEDEKKKTQDEFNSYKQNNFNNQLNNGDGEGDLNNNQDNNSNQNNNGNQVNN